ncbi:hypothetical protein GQ42DRAFT_47313 [Ramicandelaber brevisporus]|nr:hypothetical protein GQ42DRAFT_47313 [Ramicandelaber brevisporus]
MARQSGFYDEDDLEDYDSQAEEEAERLADGVKHLRGLFPSGACPLSKRELEDIVWDANFDLEQAADWALEAASKKPAKKPTVPQQQTSSSSTSNKGTTPSSSSSSSSSLLLQSSHTAPSLSQQSSSLSQLAANVTAKPSVPLSSLVQSGRGINVTRPLLTPKIASAVMSNSSNPSNPSSSSGSSGLSLAALAASASSKSSVPLTGLSSLAAKVRPSVVPRPAIAVRPNVTAPLTPAKMPQIVSPRPPVRPLGTPSSMVRPAVPSKTMTVSGVSRGVRKAAPLIAEPSSLASFILSPSDEADISSPFTDSCVASVHSLRFAKLCVQTTVMRVFPLAASVPSFDFNSPSPDDIVTASQTKKPIQNTAQSQPQNQSQSKQQPAQKNKAQAKQSPISSQPKPSPVAKVASSSSSSAAANKNRIDVRSEYLESIGNKENGSGGRLSLIVAGHVDAGKSTLMGHLLYKLGHVNDRTMKKFEKESAAIGKESFAFAWVLDNTDEERSRGVTMDVATSLFNSHFEPIETQFTSFSDVSKCTVERKKITQSEDGTRASSGREYTLLDSPGHRDFVPRMIAGASQADAAVLVVDASTGEFEAGFSGRGQSKEHALLLRSLGVVHLVVAVNKLDTQDWSQVRFNEICENYLLPYLSTQVGFKKNNIVFVPVSGLQGINIVDRPANVNELTSWYKGPCLLEVLDAIPSPQRSIDLPFKMSIQDYFKGASKTSSNIGGSSNVVTVAGRIESGFIQAGDVLLIVPGNQAGIVKSLEVREQSRQWAVAGDSVLLQLTSSETATTVYQPPLDAVPSNPGGIHIQQFSIGSVLCDPLHPIHTASKFQAQLVVFDISIPITKGCPVVVHHVGLNVPATISKLVAVLDKSTGEVTKQKPRHLSKNTTALVEIQLSKDEPTSLISTATSAQSSRDQSIGSYARTSALCLEPFNISKEFGRIAVRQGGHTIAAGIVTELIS